MHLAITIACGILGSKPAIAPSGCPTGTFDNFGKHITATACIVDTPLSAHSELNCLRDVNFLVGLVLLRRHRG